MRRRQRHAAVARGDERAGMRRRLRVDREAVRRHHAQRRPRAVDAHVAQERKDANGARGHRRHHGRVERLVEVRGPAARRRPARCRRRSAAASPAETAGTAARAPARAPAPCWARPAPQVRPSARAARCPVPPQGRRVRTRPRRPSYAAAKPPASRSIRCTPWSVNSEPPARATPACNARSSRSGLQSPSCAQYVPPATSGPMPGSRAATPARSSTSMPEALPCCAGPLRHPPRTRVQFLRRQAHVQAACLPQRDVDARLFAQQRRKPRPLARRALRPCGVGRHAEPFALHPDEAEVAACRPVRDIALVEQREPRAEVAQSERDRRADETAADHRDVERSQRHLTPLRYGAARCLPSRGPARWGGPAAPGTPSTPAKRRIAGICAANSVNEWSPPPRTYCHAPP